MIPGITASRRFSAAPSGDPFFSNVILLMNCDSGPPFLDASLTPKAISSYSDNKVSTLVKKFGPGSMENPGGVSYADVTQASAPITDFDLGATYTVELFTNPINLASNGGLLHRGFYNAGLGTWDSLTFSIRHIGGGTVRFYFYGTTSANEQRLDVANCLTVGVWRHLAMVRDGTNGRVYVDGQLAGSLSGLNLPASNLRPIRIGLWDFSAANEHFNGYFDEIRITKGVARYDADFPVPDAPFPNF